ncbi:MAG: flavodoxin-dependent (E)-4-hydroxy-3-methylbut-2-enyl-diphosphate synthase [Candidatus Muiribacteriota bacterium]
MRRKSKKIKIKNTYIGGGEPVTTQTMLTTPTKKVDSILCQIKELSSAGCDIIRLAVKDDSDAESLKDICFKSSLPVVADIHFDYKLAIKSILRGADKIRINPGNIGSDKKIKEVIKVASDFNCPIRIGVNSGSLPKKYSYPTSEAMVDCALNYIDFFEKNNFSNLVISLKSSDITLTVNAYEELAHKCPYPFHAGITEAGIPEHGIIKSSAGIGILLWKGLVDTFRISLSAPPIDEIKTSLKLLKYMGQQVNIPEIISCPTCGRCEINLIELANEVNQITENIKKPLKIAVMGCVVNGPGESKEADIGIAGGKSCGIIFMKGKPVEKVEFSKLIQRFKYYLKRML